jgi:SAM-dependent methyltransferase
MTGTLDEARIEQFAQRLLGGYVNGMTTYMIDIGHRTGLFDAAATGEATSAELAARAGLHERHVREWLGAIVTAGIAEYDPQTRTYRLPPEHAVVLTGGGSGNLARMAQFQTHLGKHVAAVVDTFRAGGGVPYAEYRPEFTAVMDAISRNFFDEQLIDGVLPLVPGLRDRLEAGARVADIGCGTGHAAVVLGAAFPRSTFVGYDQAGDALEVGRAEARGAGLENVWFVEQDVAELDLDDRFDVVVSFDTIHDQARPRAVLAGIARALTPGGTYVMVEPRVSSRLEDNLANPVAPLVYAASVMHCLQVSLAEDGEGLGTAFGEQVARQLLADAGLHVVDVQEAPGDPMDAVFVAGKPG